jgi:hypothetical protein
VRGQFSGASHVRDPEPQAALAELVHDVAHRVGDLTGVDGSACLVGQIQRVAVELGVERHPAQPRRLGDRVDSVHASEVSLGELGGQGVRPVPVEAPLVRVHVPVRCADHRARWP